MYFRRLPFRFAQAQMTKSLCGLLCSLSLWACEQDTVSVELVGVQPAQNAEVPQGQVTFSWISNGFGDYHFRLGTEDMQVILLDTVVASSQLTLAPALVRATGYHWEVTQGPAKLVRDFVTTDENTLFLVSPLNGAVLPLTGNTFTWESWSQGPFQFRLGDSGMVHVYVDETVTGHAYTPSISLQPGGSYQWEVSQPGQLITSRLRAMSIQQLAIGQHGGNWIRTQYSDPNSNVTNGTGILSVTPTGIGYTVEVVGQTSPIYVEPYRVFGGVQFCEDLANGYPHQYTDFEYDYVHNTFSLLSHYGVGNGSYTRVEFTSN
jgi:hypothetical protein